MLATAATIASLISERSPRMKPRSSLISSKRSRLSWASEDCPVPKSSIANPIPADAIALRLSRVRSSSSTSAVSVISSVSAVAGTPNASWIRASRGTRPGESSSRGERFTLSLNPATARTHGPASWHAIVKIRSARTSISPISSATAMNNSGAIGPSSGCVHRPTASAPAIEPCSSSTIGW